MGMYKTKSQRILKKYLDMELPMWGISLGKTKRETILESFTLYGSRKMLTKYINKYIKDPDVISKTGNDLKMKEYKN